MPYYFEIKAQMYKLWPGQSQFMIILSFDLKVTFKQPEQMFQMALLSSRTTIVLNYFEIHA